MYYSGSDAMFFVVILLGLVAMFASYRVKRVFAKYYEVDAHYQCTGAEAAAKMLHANGVYDVNIQKIPGELTDHYDPRDKVVRLSSRVHDGVTVASLAVACHECGHALQDAQNYSFLKFRSLFFPVANIGSKMAIPLIIIGFILSFSPLVTFGIIFFSASVIFQLVTLPVEFDASARALQQMTTLGIVTEEEHLGAKRVLTAAAMTYVAAAAVAVAQLIRLVLLNRRGD